MIARLPRKNQRARSGGEVVVVVERVSVSAGVAFIIAAFGRDSAVSCANVSVAWARVLFHHWIALIVALMAIAAQTKGRRSLIFSQVFSTL